LLYQNNGDGTFTDVASTASVGDTDAAFGTAWADYDGDGDLDLYVTNYGGANVLYRNDGDVASITLVVKPLTEAGAPSVFGAVTLSTADGNVVALRTLDGGSGYFSQNSYGAHIAGLSADTVYTVAVHEPSGVTTTTWSAAFLPFCLPSFLLFSLSPFSTYVLCCLSSFLHSLIEFFPFCSSLGIIFFPSYQVPPSFLPSFGLVCLELYVASFLDIFLSTLIAFFLLSFLGTHASFHHQVDSIDRRSGALS